MKNSTKKIIIISIITGLVSFAILLFGVWWLLSNIGKDPSGITHPQYGTYVTLFYNNKCVAAHPEKEHPGTGEIIPASTFTDKRAKNLLKYVDKLNFSKEEALELFYEARESWNKGGLHNQVGAWKNCPKETITYFNFAIDVLEDAIAQQQ